MSDPSDLRIARQSATLRALVEEKLRSAIVTGLFPPGQRLVERKLCELTGVGRTSIREGLRQLEAEGCASRPACSRAAISRVAWMVDQMPSCEKRRKQP